MAFDRTGVDDAKDAHRSFISDKFSRPAIPRCNHFILTLPVEIDIMQLSYLLLHVPVNTLACHLGGDILDELDQGVVEILEPGIVRK